MQQRLTLAASVILAVWLNLFVCYGEDLAASSTAYVAAGGAANGYSSLLAAFQNQQITKIVLATNYTVGDEFEPYAEQPILVDRDVTITGLPGTTPLLDLHRQAGVVQLCATCTLRLANISLSNLTRSGAGIVTFFRGQLGARMVQQNGFSVRLVCQRTDVELAVVNQTQRSSRFPSPPGGEQLAGSVNASYLGQSFPNAFYIQDVSLDVPLTLVRPGVYSGGFAAQWLNMTRACWEFVSEECVQRESPEVCIAQQTQQLLAAMAAGSSDGGARRAAAIAVPVAVGGALLLAALALFLHKRRRRRQHGPMLPKTAVPVDPSAAGRQTALHQQHHHQQQPVAAARSKQAVDDGSIEVVLAGSPAGSTTNVAEAQAGPAGAPAPAAVANVAVGVPAAASSVNSRAASVEGSAAEAAPTVSDANAWARRFTEHSEHSTVLTEVHADGIGNSNNSARSFVNASGLSFSSSQHHSSPHVHSGPCASISGTVSAMVPLAVAHHGWQLTSSRTTPGLQQAADSEGSSIEWGELLGAGSFGRVYKCRWAGMDVAVKVIQHDASALEAVENEVQLQMYLNHPNIVRAFHYITHTHKPSSPTSRSTISSARAGGGLAATLMTGGSGKRPSAADVSGLLGSSTTSASQGLDTFSSSSAALGMQQQQRSASWVQSHRLSPETPKGTLQWLQPASFSESATGFTAASMAPDSSSTAVLASQDAAAVAGRSSSATEAARVAQSPARVVEFEQADDGPDYVRKTKHAGSPKAAAAAAAPSSEAGYSSEGSDRSAERAASSNGGHSSSEQLGAPPGWPILMLDQPLSNSTGPGTAAGLHTLGSLALRLGASGTNSSIGGVRRGIGGGALEKKLRFKSADISETWLVQELCDCGTLASIASNYWRRETEDEVQMLQRLLLLRDVAAGMEFLHSKNIVHSDLNANNVLVSSCESSPNGLVAKLADLGLSRVINQHRTHRTTHTFGTLSHMPPCLLREGRLTTRADVYAFAMVMWQLFTGEPAWHGLHYGQFFQKVVLEHSRPPIPSDMPEDYCCLMTHCWAEEPNDRPTASVVLHCLQLMISERLKLLEHEEPTAADAADLAAAAAGGDRQQLCDGSAVGGGDQAGLGDVVADKRRSLEGPKGKAAAAAAVAAAAAAVERAVGATGSSSPL